MALYSLPVITTKVMVLPSPSVTEMFVFGGLAFHIMAYILIATFSNLDFNGQCHMQFFATHWNTNLYSTSAF